MPLRRLEARCGQQARRPVFRAGLASTPGEERRGQPPRELIDEDEGGAGGQDSGEFASQACWSLQWSNEVVLTAKSKNPLG